MYTGFGGARPTRRIGGAVGVVGFISITLLNSAVAVLPRPPADCCA